MGMGSYNSTLPSPEQFQRYLNSAGFVQPAKEPSMIEQMVARASQAQSNVPTLAQLFPMLNTSYQTPMMQTPMQNNTMSGAGRFLGQSPMMTSSAPSIPFNFNAPKA